LASPAKPKRSPPKKYLINLVPAEHDQAKALADVYGRYLSEEVRDALTLHVLERLRVIYGGPEGKRLAKERGISQGQALEEIDATLEELREEVYGLPASPERLTRVATALPLDEENGDDAPGR
jgi:hypothetical protein